MRDWPLTPSLSLLFKLSKNMPSLWHESFSALCLAEGSRLTVFLLIVAVHERMSTVIFGRGGFFTTEGTEDTEFRDWNHELCELDEYFLATTSCVEFR
jgi:hypothetical protein